MPSSASTRASGSTRWRPYTPITWALAPAGLVSGPSTLNTVRMPISRRAGITCFIAVCRSGAYRNPIPTSSMHCATFAGGKSRWIPRASTTSADPHRLETDRLPCLATLTPAPATTNAVAVETLKVPVASPPVPHVSMSISRSVPVSAASTSFRVLTRTAFTRITSANPISSSTVSPFMRSAVRIAAICAGVAPPDMIASIAAAASSAEVPALDHGADRLDDDRTAHGSSLLRGFTCANIVCTSVIASGFGRTRSTPLPTTSAGGISNRSR